MHKLFTGVEHTHDPGHDGDGELTTADENLDNRFKDYFEIVLPSVTTVAQRGVSYVRFFDKKPEWHDTMFVTQGVVCQSRPKKAIVAGSQFEMRNKDNDAVKSFYVVFPGLE